MRLTILDKYILKKYLTSFLGMFIIFIPISILASLAEKINKILDNKAPLLEVLEYYGNFTLVLGNILMPILLFLSIIFFTTRLTERSEIVAMLIFKTLLHRSYFCCYSHFFNGVIHCSQRKCAIP